MELVNRSGFAPAWMTWKIRPPIWSMIVIAKGTFELRPGETANPADPPLPAMGNIHLEDDLGRPLLYENDFAPFKPRADVLLTGRAYAPAKKPTDVLGVTLGVGAWSKSLAIASPDPFVEFPLSYEYSYGGPKDARNPLGSQAPRIVYAGRPLDTEPAGFAPLPATWDPRKKMVGSFGKDWIRTRWPWWPEDFDWNFYNAAPLDQQLESLRGDEELFLENLHPEHPRLRCRLPGVRPRMFTRGDGGFQEIVPVLDTLSIEPDQNRLVLVWRGQREVRNEKLEGVETLFLALESLTASSSREDWKERLEKEPAPSPAPPEPRAPSVSEAKPPKLEGFPDVAAEVSRMKEEASKLEAQAAKLESEARGMLQEISKEYGVSMKATSPPADPREIVRGIVEGLNEAKQAILESGREVPPSLQKAIDHPPTPADFEPPTFQRKIATPEPESKGGPEPVRAPTREEIVARKAALEGLDLTGADLAGADLSGARMRGTILRDADLSRANLEGADLSGCVLAGGDLTGIVARRVLLPAADLTGACLRAADLTEARCEEALLVGADLRNARLGRADFSDADLSRADLNEVEARSARFARALLVESSIEGADFSGANLSEAGLMRCHGAGVRFEGADLTELKASGARLPGAHAKKVRADGSVWEGADLRGSNLSFSRWKGAEFSEANLEGAVALSADVREGRFAGANLRRADLTRANLFRASLEKADLTGACFVESNLFEAETWEAVTEATEFRGANVRRTKLERKE